MPQQQLLLALVLCAVPCVAWGDEPAPRRRVWVDSTGGFRIEAELVTATATSVKLKRIDSGVVIQVPFARLSPADQDVVRQLAPEVFASKPAPATRIVSATELEAAAQKRRYAADALKMYEAFLADALVSDLQKIAAQSVLQRWKLDAAAEKVRCGNRWYTPAELETVIREESRLLQSAEQFLAAGDLKAVVNVLVKSSNLNPASIRGLFRLGILNALHPSGLSPADAEKQFQHCIRRLQSYPEEDQLPIDRANLAKCYNNAALTCVRQRRYATALDCWEKCLAQSAPVDEALHNLFYLNVLTSAAAVKQGDKSLVKLAASERARLERLLEKTDGVAKAFNPARGWRYSRIVGVNEVQAPMPDRDATGLVALCTGTGFVIGEEYVLTNRHVVQDGLAFQVRFEDEDASTAKFAAVARISDDPQIDLAILLCKGLQADPIPICSERPKLGAELQVLGFPDGDALGSAIKVSRGVVTTLPPIHGRFSWAEKSMMHDAATLGGSSGGPVISQAGQILGVHYARHPSSDQFKFAVTAENAIAFAQPVVADLVVNVSPGPPFPPWENTVERVRKSTTQIIVLAEPDRFAPVDPRFGEIQWDPYDDPWCMACNGRISLDCPVRGCARGGVRAFSTEVVPNTLGGVRVTTTPIRVKCDTCGGRGRVSCSYCEYGIDPRFINDLNRSWLIRYADLVKRLNEGE